MPNCHNVSNGFFRSFLNTLRGSQLPIHTVHPYRETSHEDLRVHKKALDSESREVAYVRQSWRWTGHIKRDCVNLPQ